MWRQSPDNNSLLLWFRTETQEEQLSFFFSWQKKQKKNSYKVSKDITKADGDIKYLI